MTAKMSKRTETEMIEPDKIRLNRYIALCGLCSRRDADKMIEGGRVEVNGKKVSEFGFRVGEEDAVSVDGVEISPAKETYLILNKPRGVLCAVSDIREKTVIDILPDCYAGLGLFPVGRLDKESEGLIIITNDGIFSQELIHPSKGYNKTYEVKLRTRPTEAQLSQWRSGVEAGGRILKPLSVRPMDVRPKGLWFEVVLAEGIKREIRLMARALGNDVSLLYRSRIGKLELRRLKSGEFISVSKEELWRYIKGGKIV